MVRMPKAPDGWFDAEVAHPGEAADFDLRFTHDPQGIVPTPSFLLDGLPDSEAVSTLHWFMNPKEIATIPGLPKHVYDQAAKDVRRLPQATANTRESATIHKAAAVYDGVCRLPDGSDHPYVDTGGGFGEIYGAGNPNTNGQFGVGEAANGTTAPISPKRGGLGGGGKSGLATSPASRAARGLTGSARLPELGRISPTISVGGTIGRVIPLLGAPMMWLDVLEHQSAPNCIQVIDPTKVY